MIYFDTSYLGRLYFDEPGHEAVRSLASTDKIACAWHGQAEVIAMFHRKFREKTIRQTHYRALLEQFAIDREAGAFTWLPAGPAVLERIAEVYSNLPAAIYLRAADALHLATAELHGYRMVHSNDAHFLAAAPQFHLTPKNVIRAH